MTDNRELDALVAEKVMRWRRVGYWLAHGRTSIALPGNSEGPPTWDELDAPSLPHYSTDIAAAWAMVEAVNEIGSPTSSYERWARFHDLMVDDGPHYLWPMKAEEVAHYLCVVMLEAVGVDVKALGLERYYRADYGPTPPTDP